MSRPDGAVVSRPDGGAIRRPDGRREERRTGATDCGSASLWVLTGGLLVLTVALFIGLRATAVVARHRAELAADLAALAAAQGIGIDASTAQMCGRGARIAAGNGARLQKCTVRLEPSARSGTVQVVATVVVHIAGLGTELAVAHAEARRDPGG